MAMLPLTVGAHFGLLLLSVALYGIWGFVRRRQWRPLAALALFFLPLTGMLALNENWTQEDKWGIVVITYLPIFLCIGSGLKEILRRDRWTVGRIAAVTCLCISLVLSQKGLLGVDGREDERFRSYWSREVQPLLPEDPTYLELERKRLGKTHWLPRTLPYLLLYEDDLRMNLVSLPQQLKHFSLRDRQLSLGEAAQIMFMGMEGPLARLLPAHVQGLGVLPESTGIPASISFSLSEPIHRNLDPGDPQPFPVKTCSPGEGIIDLLPLEPPVVLQVPWNEGPILAGLTATEGVNFLLLWIIRIAPREMESLFFERPPEKSTCIRPHLSPDKRLVIMDLISFDPSRSYAFRVFEDPPPSNALRLEVFRIHKD